ncbi:MAG TPA: glutaredoxin family protein [Solirubrobacteraceae bacterium]|nr:glutaredoxin family protein [Solirubrobacteraceae bacterium]
MSDAPTVVLYSRPGCHLCDEARAVIRRVAAVHPFALTERNIDESDQLLRTYLERIPVICIDGVESFELFVDEPRFSAALAARRAERSQEHPPGD